MMDRRTFLKIAGMGSMAFATATAFQDLGPFVLGNHALYLQQEIVFRAIPDGAVESGWRLVPEYWGKGYASEAALALLEFGFNKFNLWG